MSEPMNRVLSALRDYGHKPRRSGGGWYCRCPAHDDRTPSLSIAAGDDGRALVNCHAGCTVDAVCSAIGLRPADLFEPAPTRRNGTAPRTRRVTASTKTRTVAPASDCVDGDGAKSAPRRTFSTAGEAVDALERQHGPRAAWWPYHNAAGEPAALIVRWNAPHGKDIRPVSRTPDGTRWRIGAMPTPRPLYRLPELLAAPAGARVWVCEGERAADAARAVGLVATTSAHGSKSAGQSDWSPLAGRDVVVLPDHDDPGERYADDVARLAMAAGAKSVRVARLAELWAEMPKGGDMADFVEHRGGDVDAIRAEVETLAGKAEPESVALGAPAIPKYVPFPVDVLPEPIRSFVMEAAKSIGCDPANVALPLLSALASAIGNTHRIELKNGWTEPAIVWTSIVAESGAKKSPPIERAVAQVRKRQHAAMKRHAEAMKKHAEALTLYERDLARWKKSKSDDPPPAKPDVPIAERCWTDDATTEAVAALLQQNPRGLLMVRDELAGWFNFDRYASGKGGDAAKWLEMFGGRAMVVDRKTGGTLYVPYAAVSIAGGIQPETLRRALGQEHLDNGLAARLLFAMPERRILNWTEAEVSASVEAALATVFDRLFGLTMENDPASVDALNPDLRPRLVRLTHEGKAEWVRFYNEHATEQVNLSGNEAAAWSKLEGYAARLALVVHLVRWAADDPTLAEPARVDEGSIAVGVVLARWFGDEARRVYAVLSESEDDRETRGLMELIRRKGGSVSGRELVQGSRRFRSVAGAEAELAKLAEAGAGSWVTPPQRGPGAPKARRFVLAPAYGVNVYRNPVEAAGNGNPVDVDRADTAPSDGRWEII